MQKDRSYQEIHTARCILHLIEKKYAENIHQTCTLEVCEWFDYPIHQDIKAIHKQILDWEDEYNERKSINLAILNEDNRFIGDVEVRHIDTGELSMGIWLGTEYQKQGYGLEVIKGVVERINNNLIYDFIKWECYKDNTGSVTIAHTIGATLYKMKKTNHWKYGEIDDCIYHIKSQNDNNI